MAVFTLKYAKGGKRIVLNLPLKYILHIFYSVECTLIISHFVIAF